jgi:HD-GYP domain-containing protein (c-di-GMP phosphodiesterase class II)
MLRTMAGWGDRVIRAISWLLSKFNLRIMSAAELETLISARTEQARKGIYETEIERLVIARTEQLRKSVKELEESCDSTLEALGDALDLKEAQTKFHSKRVTAYAIGIAKTMGISPDEIRVIARGAFLHDIGRMAIPAQILNKPGPLDPSEWQIMREYCLRGYQIVKKIPFLSEAAEIIYAHQERYDGTGYPRGLRETDIPLGARIVAIANTLDAITSNRPYRAAQSLDFAREEIAGWSGRQFDPDIVKIFFSMPANIWEALRTDIGRGH